MANHLIDREALEKHRERARRQRGRENFLQAATLNEVEVRLELVNRSFTKIAIVTPEAEVWQAAYPGAKVVPDDETLDLSPGAHDLVVHAMALHWSNDPVGQLIQCRRSLKPDGLLLCLTLGGQTLSELRTALAEAEVSLTGGLSPRVLPMGELRDLGALLQRAGFALPVADSFRINAEYTSPRALMRDLRDLGETNALSDRRKHPTPATILRKADELYCTNFATASGRIRATFEIVSLTGWSPDASQPLPLRPGSATTRLADALGTIETPIDDDALNNSVDPGWQGHR